MLQKCSMIKVAKVFFEEPTKEHYLIEISKKSRLAHTSVKKHLEELKKISIINETKEKKGNRTYPIYKANINGKEYRYNKKIYNETQIRKLTNFLADNIAPNSIILFGSYQKGEDTEDSDIDIYLECKESKIDLKIFEKQLKRKIQLHFKKEFEEYPKELKNNILNGNVLYGYIEAFR